jgi:hypothetical protein
MKRWVSEAQHEGSRRAVPSQQSAESLEVAIRWSVPIHRRHLILGERARIVKARRERCGENQQLLEEGRGGLPGC